jgi:hypothetical protein
VVANDYRLSGDDKNGLELVVVTTANSDAELGLHVLFWTCLG